MKLPIYDNSKGAFSNIQCEKLSLGHEDHCLILTGRVFVSEENSFVTNGNPDSVTLRNNWMDEACGVGQSGSTADLPANCYRMPENSNIFTTGSIKSGLAIIDKRRETLKIDVLFQFFQDSPGQILVSTGGVLKSYLNDVAFDGLTVAVEIDDQELYQYGYTGQRYMFYTTLEAGQPMVEARGSSSFKFRTVHFVYWNEDSGMSPPECPVDCEREARVVVEGSRNFTSQNFRSLAK